MCATQGTSSISECASGLARQRSHALEPRVGQRRLAVHKGRCLALVGAVETVEDVECHQVGLRRSGRRRRRRSALARAERRRCVALARQLSSSAAQQSSSPAVRQSGSAGAQEGWPAIMWASVPFDGGIGGEMTRSNAADPKQALLAYPLMHTSKSFEWWLGAIPACIKPVWGARNVIEAAREQLLARRSPPECSMEESEKRTGRGQTARYFVQLRAPSRC